MCDILFFPTLFRCGFHVLRSLPFLCQVLIMNKIDCVVTLQKAYAEL